MSRYAFTGNKEKEELLDLMYPIGSIYISTNNTNPSTIFGGYWRKIENKFLLGASDIYQLGSQGGEASHTLTIDEMPSHTHTFTARSITSVVDAGGQQQAANDANATYTTKPTGGDQAHNNMPPYLSVNIWERFFPAQKGETYTFDGIEVYCLLGTADTDHPLFVDKNHDLSYYVNGSDWVDSSDYNTSPGTFGYEWGGWGLETGVTATAVGSGLSNTNSLIEKNLQLKPEGWYVVWDKIREFRQSHSDNWFLPSLDELDLIYEARSNLSNLSLNTNPYYWSSSEYSSDSAWGSNFNRDIQRNVDKGNHYHRSRLCYTI